MRANAILLVALALAVGAVPSAASAAGTYTVSSCSPTNSPGAWQQIDTFPTGMTSGEQCGGPAIGPVGSGDQGALFGEDLIGSTAAIPSGSRAGWQITAPAGIAITAISYYRSVATGLNLDWAAGLFAGSGQPLDTCTSNPDACSSANNQIPQTIGALDTPSLFFGAQCQPVPPDTDCLAGSSLNYAQAQIYSANVTLAEGAAPAVSNIAGSLWGGGVTSGTAAVMLGASDPSGISQVAVAGPNGAVASQPEVCDYTQTRPCPQLPEGSVSVNTTQLHDGPQTLTLFVTNAAGHTTSVQSPPVVVDNNGPPAPASFTASPVASDTRAIALTWSDPANAPQPVTGAHAELCQASCAAPVAVTGSGSARLDAPGPGTYIVHFWLTDRVGRGGPANAATHSVTIPASSSGSTSAGSREANALRLSHHLKGRELTVTVRLPSGAGTAVTVTIRAYRGSRQDSPFTRHVKARDRIATLHFKLSLTDLRATKLALTAAAAHARSATILILARASR
jgi:hypothetical protein